MLLILKRLKLLGYKPYALIGGATGLIGDPSGKKHERQILSLEQIKTNVQKITKQINTITGVSVINNNTFYQNINLFDFLRDVGKLINVNYLLEKESIKLRLETGISFSEFTYGLIQGYDFAHLYQNNHITLQIGGSDQWGNITTGIELIRKICGEQNDACGLTINLLTKADGTKFGKSESGAVYLDASYTSPYQLYQFLINQSDKDVIKLLKFLTFYTKDEIAHIIKTHEDNVKKRYAQKQLAKAVVQDIHGAKAVINSEFISAAFFEDRIDTLSVPQLIEALKDSESFVTKKNQYDIVTLLVESKICASKTAARKLIDEKAIYVNKELVNDYSMLITKANALDQKISYIKKGKRNYYLVIWQ
jgi:tyrosyl-tRNA synthetase